MRKLTLLILSFSLPFFIYGQDSLSVQEKDKFGVRVKEKFNFSENIDFFKYISDSKSQNKTCFFENTSCSEYNGKIIRKIYVDVLSPFEHIDTSTLRRPKFYNLANNLNQATPDRIVKQQLLFKEGDKIDEKVIYESGRILFESGYFRDAQIIIVPDENDPDIVDVLIWTQDLWSWTFGGEATDKYVGGQLGFNKFAGLPQRLVGGLKFNFDKKNLITPRLKYRYRNIKGSFVDAGANWSHDWRDYTYEFNLGRGFYSSKPQWAGAGEVGWYREYYDKTKEFAFLNKQDFWVAKSFPFKLKQHEYLNLIVAARTQRKRYTSAPSNENSEYEDRTFTNSNSYMFAIGIANRYYVKEKNIFDFYKYRNLPSGFNMHFVGGLINNTNHPDRGYIGTVANHSLMTCAGYFQEEFGAGTFFSNGIEQLTFHLKSKYFTHKIPLKKWGFRQFIYQSFVFGFLRPEGADLLLGESDVKGLRNNYEGNSFYSLNLESEIHSPVKFMGFQARIFVFADLGLQGNKSNIPLGGSRFYHAYGVGARLNNWKLGIGYLELAFVYYPNTNGIGNNPLEFHQNYHNTKIIESNSLYLQSAVSTVN